METKAKKVGFFTRFLNGVERVGNKMCHPLTLFVIIAAIILLCSWIFGGATVINPVSGDPVTIVNLLTGEGLSRMLINFTVNARNFPPLILVLVCMFGVGLFDSTGFAEALMKRTVLKASPKVVIPILLFISININVAGDAGFILMPIVGAMVFAAMGKNPIAGMCLCYAGVAGGFSACIMVGATESVIIGFTETAARLIDPNYNVSIMMNYYFIAASAIVLVPVGMFINNRFVEPRLGKLEIEDGAIDKLEDITADQKRGLRWGGIAFVIFIALLLLVSLPKNAPLRDPETGSLMSMTSGFMGGIVTIIALVFFIPSLFYGIGARVFKSDKDVADHLGKAMSSMGSYIAFCIVAAQMINYFSWSNIGTYLAISGANFLSSINLTGIGLLVVFVIITALINFLISSNSAKWAILGPVFVPMFMLLGLDPAVTQCAYRIGDSVTNCITPMMAYLAILVGLAQKYDKKAGMGSLMSALLPYSIGFFIFWTLFLVLWYVLKLPIGPGYGIFLK